MVSETIQRKIIVLFILLLSFSSLITVFVKHLDLNQKVDSPYLNGLITTCGVFVAFICASTISKAQDLDSTDYLLVRLSLLTFIAAVLKLSVQLVLGFPATLTELVMISGSLSLCGFTTWSIMHTLFRKSHS